MVLSVSTMPVVRVPSKDVEIGPVKAVLTGHFMSRLRQYHYLNSSSHELCTRVKNIFEKPRSLRYIHFRPGQSRSRGIYFYWQRLIFVCKYREGHLWFITLYPSHDCNWYKVYRKMGGELAPFDWSQVK